MEGLLLGGSSSISMVKGLSGLLEVAMALATGFLGVGVS